MAFMLKASGAKLFPWKHWDEWYQVMEDLFQNDPTKVYSSLGIISNWRYKMAIPVAVDSCAQLIQLLWKQDTISEPIFSLALSCAIVRLVNGLVDNLQDAPFAVSVTGLASQLGLPVFVAEMRHDISHNALPCKEALLFAANECLEWLRRHYVVAQRERRIIGDDILSYLQQYQVTVQEDYSRKRWLAVEITKRVSDSSVGSVLFPALVDGYLIPKEYRWNASVEAILERWREALQIFQQRWPFFVPRLYWYIFQKGCKMGTSDKRLSLVFGWLRWITVDMSQWLSDMEHKWMSQTIEFSIRLYQNKNCETMDSFHQWLQVSKMESSKSCWNVLSYETDDGLLELVSCTENSLPQVANEEQTTIIITSWTKCEQPLDCPIGSLVDRKKANLLYRQTEDKKKEDTGNPSVKTTSCLSDDFIQRICQF